MAGHSKWANIKHRKGAQDKKRAKIFTRILKEISVAVKEGGGADPETNPRLRLAIQNAKGANMPKDTIERAIKKASGADADNYEEVTYEGYAPNGVAVFIECTTDNTNRTVASVRSIFTKSGGSLGTNGSLEFIFDRKGIFHIEEDQIKMDWEEFELEAIDGGAEEVEKQDGLVHITTSFDDFGTFQKKLDELGIEAKSAELERIPNSYADLSTEQALSVLKIIEKFEDDEDVQNVFHNIEMTDELMQALEADE